MHLSDNERKFLQAMSENEFHTIAQVAHACDFHRAQAYHYYRALALGGLIDGFDVTYAGYKMLSNEQLSESDDFSHIAIKLQPVHDPRKDYE